MLKVLRRTSDSIDCTRAARLLPLYVGGDIEETAAQALTQHLHDCPQCRARAADYAASHAWLHAGAQPEFADDFYDGIRAAVLRRIKDERRPIGPQPVPFFAPLFNQRARYVAASVALLLLVGALAWHAFSGRTNEPGQPALANANSDSVQPPRVVASPRPLRGPSPEQRQTPPNTPLRKRQSTRTDMTTAALPRVRNGQDKQSVSPPPRNVVPVPPADGGQFVAVNQAHEAAANAAAANVAATRIELQTADPNIRIIWLAQQPADDARATDTPSTPNK
jgi:Putative zinc-finger